MVKPPRTALIVGATGLVGSNLLQQLAADPSYQVIILTRRKTDLQYNGVVEYLIDFDQPLTWPAISVDEFYCCLGTTKAVAGRTGLRQVDVDYVVSTAAYAHRQGARTAVIISAFGAAIPIDTPGVAAPGVAAPGVAAPGVAAPGVAASGKKGSPWFYFQMKTQMQQAVSHIGFKQLVFMQPGLIKGRPPSRWLEGLAIALLETVTRFAFKRHRPISADTLAKAMRSASLVAQQPVHYYVLDELFDLSDVIDTIDTAVNQIRAGKTIVYPTEAVYGLGCDPDNEQAVRQLLKLKQRSWKKGLILIGADVAQFAPWVNLEQLAQPYIEASWPGANTWIVSCRAEVPDWLRGEHDSLAVRVTDHPVCRALCQRLGSALISTSANPAGQNPAITPEQAQRYFPDLLVVEGPLGQATQPSTIRDALTQAVYRA